MAKRILTASQLGADFGAATAAEKDGSLFINAMKEVLDNRTAIASDEGLEEFALAAADRVYGKRDEKADSWKTSKSQAKKFGMIAAHPKGPAAWKAVLGALDNAAKKSGKTRTKSLDLLATKCRESLCTKAGASWVLNPKAPAPTSDALLRKIQKKGGTASGPATCSDAAKLLRSQMAAFLAEWNVDAPTINAISKAQDLLGEYVEVSE